MEGEAQGPARRARPRRDARRRRESPAAARLRFGFSVLFNWRFSGTPYQARGVPELDEKLRRSRPRFLAHALLTVAVCYLVLDAMDAAADPGVAERFYSLDKVAFFSRIQDVSAAEVVMRFFAAVGLGAGLVCVQRGVYNIFAVVSVAARLSEPGDWPPFNGPFGKIDCLRNF